MLTTQNYVSAASLLVALASVAACSDDATSSITGEDYDDVARSIGSTVGRDSGGESAAFADAVDLAVGIVPIGFTGGAAGEFNGVRFGLSYFYDLTCRNTNCDELVTCGDTTDTAEIDFAWSGALSLLGFSAAVVREGEFTLTALQTPTARLDGNSTFSYDSTITSANRSDRRYALDYHASYDAILIAQDGRAISGGTATYQLGASRMVDGAIEAAFDVDASLVFHTDNTATLTLDGERNYRVQLATGAVVRI